MSGKRYRRETGELAARERPNRYSAIHQIRTRLPIVFVSRVPSSAKSVRRAWTHRRVRGNCSATSPVFTAGPSLSRITAKISSSLTRRGRPASPIPPNQPSWVINWLANWRRPSGGFKPITNVGYNRASQSRRALFGAPARYRRAGLASRDRLEAMKANAPRSLESTGSIDTTTHQTYLDHFGFISASQRRLNELAREGHIEGDNQEGSR